MLVKVSGILILRYVLDYGTMASGCFNYSKNMSGLIGTDKRLIEVNYLFYPIVADGVGRLILVENVFRYERKRQWKIS